MPPASQKPSAANKSTGAPRAMAMEFPNAAPMKNNGVTSPPLNPALSVMTVKRSFHAHALAGISVEENMAGRVMASGRFPNTPRPR